MQAANEKHPIALVHLAKIFEKGQHMPQDLSAAADYYKQAADLGDIPAAYAYGVICRDGVGVPIDAKVAQEYLDLASAAGYTHPKPASRDDVPIWGPAPRPKSLGSATYS
jgi:TPR repeat protein